MREWIEDQSTGKQFKYPEKAPSNPYAFLNLNENHSHLEQLDGNTVVETLICMDRQ